MRMTPIGTIPRFERYIVTPSFLDEIIAQKKKQQGTDKRVTHVEEKSKDPQVKGTVTKDPMFSGKLFFAPAFDDDNNEYGRPWSEPLVNVEGDSEYFVSCEITQLQADGPTYQIQGFETTWQMPVGWHVADGKPNVMWDEAISNPLYIRRIFKSPEEITNFKGFRIVISNFWLA